MELEQVSRLVVMTRVWHAWEHECALLAVNRLLPRPARLRFIAVRRASHTLVPL